MLAAALSNPEPEVPQWYLWFVLGTMFTLAVTAALADKPHVPVRRG